MRTPSATVARDGLLLLLAVAAGCVDAVSYLGLGEVFTAAMTGNTVLLGLAIGQGRAQAALRSIVALAGFVAGAVAGRVIVGRGPEGSVWPPAVTLAFALELVVLVCLAFGWYFSDQNPAYKVLSLYLLIVGAGVAMGMQSAAVRRLDVPGVATTYVTGTLTSLAARLVDRLRALPTGGQDSPPPGERPAHTPGVRAYVWIAYGVGAAAGGAASRWWKDAGVHIHWQPVALVLPVILIALVIIGASMRYRSVEVRT